MAQLCCKNVGFAYGGETVLSGVNFSVNAGDYLCIVGENGSGKSTLMKGILGLKEPSEGEIVFGDGLKANEIGYLPQQTGIQRDFPASVGEVVLSGRISGMGHRLFYSRADREAASENLERMGIEELKDRCYMELSGGQQQRVAIARALAKEPALLLLDEPLSNLDAKLRVEMREEILRIQRASRVTTVFVTHDQEEASSISDTVVLLKLGVLQQLGTARQLYDQPSNYFVADFLGAPPINKLRGTLEQGCFRFENTSLTCPVAPVKNVPDGTPVILALRAESVLVPAAGESRLMTTVKERYSIGKDELSVLEAGGQQLRAFIPGDYPLEPGQQLEIGFKKRGFFLFDAQTGERLQ